MRVTAQTGSSLVAYRGFRPEDADTFWDGQIDITPYLRDQDLRFFFPFTTTLVEVRLNREPFPYDGVSEMLKFVPRTETADA